MGTDCSEQTVAGAIQHCCLFGCVLAEYELESETKTLEQDDPI